MAPPLAGLLLIWALPAAAAPCPIYTQVGPSPLQEDDVACRLAVSLREDVTIIARHAGIEPVPYVLVFTPPDASAAAMYDSGHNQVLLSAPYLARNPPRAELRFILAHELGHGVQARRPEGRRRAELEDAISRSLTDGEYEAAKKAFNDFSRIFEAHADLIALQLLGMAYPEVVASEHIRVAMPCGQHGGFIPTTHPTNPRRISNALRAEALLGSIGRRETNAKADSRLFFDGGAVRQDGTIVPAVPFSDIAPDGRVRLGGAALRSLGVGIPPPAELTGNPWARHYAAAARAAASAVMDVSVMPRTALHACPLPEYMRRKLPEETGPASWPERMTRWFTGS